MGDPIRKPWLHHLKPIPLKPNLVLLVFTTKTLPFWDVSPPSNPNRTQLCLAQFKKKLDHPRNRGLIHQGYQPLTTTQKKLKWFPFPMSQGFRSAFSAKYHWENWERSCSDFPIFQFSGFPISQWFSIGKISSANPTGPTNTFFLRQWSAAQHLPGQLNLGGVPGWTCR